MCTCSSFAPNNYAPHDNSPCDENGGTCMNGKCVSDAPAPVVLGFDVKSLNETCQELRGTQSTFAKEDAHDNCQVLRCRFPCPHCETCVCFSAYEEFVAPDYAKCGRAGDSRRCLDRECVELWV
ncbi:unnamed protein product [Allacma fusca]|uniref:Uncharacterized protein n=1 Tax=Allacma fusca TaxID=39272 RepID=A0A8J2MHB0_9HEXA|nr:unnamed protein product [Allacma fusca]